MIQNLESELYNAIYNNDSDLVIELIDRGADINLSIDTNEHYTPLMVAVMNKKYEIVEILLDRGADVNISSRCGQTALHFAADCVDSCFAKKLLDFGANANRIINPHVDFTPLRCAILQSNKDTVKLLLEHTDTHIESEMLFAAKRSIFEIVDLFINMMMSSAPQARIAVHGANKHDVDTYNNFIDYLDHILWYFGTDKKYALSLVDKFSSEWKNPEPYENLRENIHKMLTPIIVN